MAGIGNRDNARPIIRGNRCYRNKMAGIGSRDGARALIEGNVCYENEMAGIGSRLGAAPVIRGNRCYRNKMAGIGAREKSRPIIEDNECFENVMDGIGVRTGAEPVVRNNRCYRNEMAGIGNRLEARPVIVGNACFENKMAGIGTEEGAAPIIRDNRCYKNLMAGIGNQSGSRPVIVGNESRENKMAGIGVRSGSVAVIVGNRCIENQLVAIGLPDGATAHIQGNELQRTGGGAPPLVAVKGGSSAVLVNNSIRGGGVAGVLVQGTAQLSGNRFFGAGGKQGSAIWVWDKSTVLASGNQFTGYRNALNASGSDVTATDNAISKFNGPAIIVRKPSAPPRVHGNTAFSQSEKDSAVKVEGADAVADNVVKQPNDAGVAPSKWQALWPKKAPAALPEQGKVLVKDGPWKLIVTHGKTTRYELYNTTTHPEQKTNLADKLEQITFRLRGLTERQWAVEVKAKLP
jgi:parallel beta-helix repeat protein